MKKPLIRKTKFRCIVCGLLTTGRIPKRGDMSFRFPRRHKINGKDCKGNIEEAKWEQISLIK